MDFVQQRCESVPRHLRSIKPPISSPSSRTLELIPRPSLPATNWDRQHYTRNLIDKTPLLSRTDRDQLGNRSV